MSVRWIFTILENSTTEQMIVYAAVLMFIDILCAMCFDRVVERKFQNEEESLV